MHRQYSLTTSCALLTQHTEEDLLPFKSKKAQVAGWRNHEKPAYRQDIELNIQLEKLEIRSMYLISRKRILPVTTTRRPNVCMKTRGEMCALTAECTEAESKD